MTMSIEQESVAGLMEKIHSAIGTINDLTLQLRVLEARERAYCGFGQASLERHPAKKRRTCTWWPIEEGYRERFLPPIAFTCGGDGGGGG